MQDFTNSDVYEFVENRFIELEKEDGGYNPSKHDNMAYKEASEKFNISLNEVDKIYSSHNKALADKALKGLSSLPPNALKRKQMIQNILMNNKNLPYYELEGPPTEKIKSGLEVIYQDYPDIAKLIGKSGWSIPVSMGFSELELLKDSALTDEVMDDFFDTFFNDIRFSQLVKHVNKSSIEPTQLKLFNECVDAFNSQRYMISTTSLLSVFEGLLSQYYEDKKNIRMMLVCKNNYEDALNSNKMIKYIIWLSIYTFVATIYEKSDFDGVEPEMLNRHWILHGRTSHELSRTDALRLFNGIYTLATMLKHLD